MPSLFFAIWIFSQFVNSCLFDVCYNGTGLRSIALFLIYIFQMLIILFLYFYISKVFFHPSFQISFIFPIYSYNLSDKFLILHLVECYLQKMFDGVFVLWCEYYVVVFEDFVKFIMC